MNIMYLRKVYIPKTLGILRGEDRYDLNKIVTIYDRKLFETDIYIVYNEMFLQDTF